MDEKRIILLAEDEKTDAYFVQWAFRTAELPHHICCVQDGQEAIDYLSGEGVYGNRAEYPVPDLLLLDLKMPRLDGFAVLTWLRRRPNFAALPVVVLSSSQFPADVQRACGLGAADYHVKPGNPQKLVELARHLHERWLKPGPKAAQPPAAKRAINQRR